MTAREYYVPAKRLRSAAWEERSFDTEGTARECAIQQDLDGYRDVRVCRNGMTILDRLGVGREAAVRRLRLRRAASTTLDVVRQLPHVGAVIAAVFEGSRPRLLSGTKTLNAGLMRKGGYRKGPARTRWSDAHDRILPTRSQSVGV
jgi:hypothetical protein